LPERRNRGSLIIVSAPSGAGKTTLCRKLVSTVPHLRFSVSFTTRQARQGEINDKDYTFIGREDFLAMIERGEFIEWAEVHGAFYGTSKRRLEEILDSGADVILDIDTQGAVQIKEKYKEGTYIFILPPSMEVLRQRLERRMTDSREEMEKRLRTSVSEIRTYREYDYVIINDIFEKALKEVEAVIVSNRVRTRTVEPLWIEESFLKQEES
jgi:guanylate kinase